MPEWEVISSTYYVWKGSYSSTVLCRDPLGRNPGEKNSVVTAPDTPKPGWRASSGSMVTTSYQKVTVGYGAPLGGSRFPV